MSPDLMLVLVVGVLLGTGATLLLERSLTRVVLGAILFGNGINLLILLGGRPGEAPILGVTEPHAMSDPLPQAMVLTAIVITLGLTAFLLAMAYRSWQLIGHDEVQDDLEDDRIQGEAERHGEVDAYDAFGPEPARGAERIDPEQIEPEPPPRRPDRETGDTAGGTDGRGRSDREAGR